MSVRFGERQSWSLSALLLPTAFESVFEVEFTYHQIHPFLSVQCSDYQEIYRAEQSSPQSNFRTFPSSCRRPAAHMQPLPYSKPGPQATTDLLSVCAHLPFPGIQKRESQYASAVFSWTCDHSVRIVKEKGMELTPSDCKGPRPLAFSGTKCSGSPLVHDG